MDMNKRPDDMVRITTPELAQAFIDEQIAAIKAQVGDKKVLLALSGGVDSSVVAALLIKAIGKQLVCVHVNHGLLRKGEPEQVVQVFRHQMDANLVYVDAVDRFLDKLAGVAEPERKRKIIGAITPEKVAIVQDADAIWREEVDKLPLDARPSQYFAALTNMQSVGVMGDERTYDYAIALRAVTTTDFMTAEVTPLPAQTITAAANRIVNEVKHVNRVLFDYTTKPPATIEFE